MLLDPSVIFPCVNPDIVVLPEVNVPLEQRSPAEIIPEVGERFAVIPEVFRQNDLFRFDSMNFINNDFEYDDDDEFHYDDFDDDFDEDFEELPDDEFEDFPDPYGEDEEDSEEEILPDDMEEVDPFDDDFDDLDSDENTFVDDDAEDL